MGPCQVISKKVEIFGLAVAAMVAAEAWKFREDELRRWGGKAVESAGFGALRGSVEKR